MSLLSGGGAPPDLLSDTLMMDDFAPDIDLLDGKESNLIVQQLLITPYPNCRHSRSGLRLEGVGADVKCSSAEQCSSAAAATKLWFWNGTGFHVQSEYGRRRSGFRE